MPNLVVNSIHLHLEGIVNRGYSGLVCALAIDGRIQSFVTFSNARINEMPHPPPGSGWGISPRLPNSPSPGVGDLP